MTARILATVAATATLAFVALATATPAQAAPHVAVVIHAGAHAPERGDHGSHDPGYRPVPRPHPQAAHHTRPGHWEHARPAYGPVYRPPAPHYGHVQHHNGHRGHNGPYAQPRPPRWDRDGDGVPNRHDRRPNNPYRY